jgi:integrase
MASVRRRKGSKFWFACITLPDSKQRQFSTGLTDEKEALALAVATERSLRQHAEKPHQLRAAFERLAEDYTPPEDAAVAEWLTGWAAARKGTVSEGTAELYRHVVKQAGEWLVGHGVTRFSGVTTDILTKLRDHWAKTLAAPTVNVRMQVLRIALGAAVQAKRLAENPGKGVPRLLVTATRRREFRPAELDLLLPTLTGEWRALFLMGLYTGQRLNDLAELRWKSVDLASKTVVLTARKTGALVALPLVPAVVDAMVALPSSDNPDAPVFAQVDSLPRSSRSAAFRAKLAAVGLARVCTENSGKAKKETSELSFHSLRHTATSMLKAAGVSDAIARAIIGHESAAVSRAYTHLDMETMRKALEKLPGA